MRAVLTVVAAGCPTPSAWERGDIVCGAGLLVQGIMLIIGVIGVLIAVIPTVNRAPLSATA